MTIPVSPTSRYTAVYRSGKKYRETAQVSRVSTIPYGSYHWATSSLLACDAKTNVIATHSTQSVAQVVVTQSPRLSCRRYSCHSVTTACAMLYCEWLLRSFGITWPEACRLLVAKWYEQYGIVDTRDTCAVSRYFLLLRYTAVYRDVGDTGIVT